VRVEEGRGKEEKEKTEKKKNKIFFFFFFAFNTAGYKFMSIIKATLTTTLCIFTVTKLYRYPRTVS
jgi:hypothetical protein